MRTLALILVLAVFGCAPAITQHQADRPLKKRQAPKTSLEPRSLDSPIQSDRREFQQVPYEAKKMSCEEIVSILSVLGPENDLDPALLLALIRVESAFSTNVLSRVAAIGLMQVMPENVERFSCGDPFDPTENIKCGIIILKRFLNRYDGNLMLALSGYNAGLGMPNRARTESRIPANFSYLENILRVRARYLRYGCKTFD